MMKQNDSFAEPRFPVRSYGKGELAMYYLPGIAQQTAVNQLMEERTDLKYMTDIMPAANETFAAKFAGRYFSTPKKMGAQTAEANINAGIAAAKQIVGFLKDGCEKFRVNK